MLKEILKRQFSSSEGSVTTLLTLYFTINSEPQTSLLLYVWKWLFDDHFLYFASHVVESCAGR